MRATLNLCSLVCLLGFPGCGDNGGGTETGSDSSGTSSSGGVVDTSSTGDETPTGEPATTGPVTSTGETTGTQPGTTSTDEGTTGGESTTGDETTGGAIDCDAVGAGPFTLEVFVSGFTGSEDLAFDGKGGLALKRGADIVVVRADKSETTLAMAIPPAYGTRFLADGRLLVALPQGGAVITVDETDVKAKFLGGLKGPNGIYPDLEGNVWVTEFGGSRLIRVAADMSETTIVSGAAASSANGVVYDPLRGFVFYTNYQSGQIRRVAIDGEGTPGSPALVTTIADAAPDGLTLDACGNLYVVDQGNSVLYRVMLDELGQATAPAIALASFPSNVANAQFGVGDGFDARTLYLAGNPGDVYALALEVPGAPIVTVQ
ncbi:MAG TPA: SMP-30/gluconolactonase/LRE family protein [Nannocystis sp.]|jgi:hypothetical protein